MAAIPFLMSGLHFPGTSSLCGGGGGRRGAVRGKDKPSHPLAGAAQAWEEPRPSTFSWATRPCRPRAGGTGAPQDPPLYFSGPLSQGGPPSGGGAPEPRKASRPAGPRVPGGVARAAQDSRLPPPAVGAGPAPSTAPSWALCVQGQASCRQLERPITALGPAGWDRPSGSLDIPHPGG